MITTLKDLKTWYKGKPLKILYMLVEDDAQDEAQNFRDRKLTQDELLEVSKRFEASGVMGIFNNIVDDVIIDSDKKKKERKKHVRAKHHK